MYDPSARSDWMEKMRDQTGDMWGKFSSNMFVIISPCEDTGQFHITKREPENWGVAGIRSPTPQFSDLFVNNLANVTLSNQLLIWKKAIVFEINLENFRMQSNLICRSYFSILPLIMVR